MPQFKWRRILNWLLTIAGIVIVLMAFRLWILLYLAD